MVDSAKKSSISLKNSFVHSTKKSSILVKNPFLHKLRLCPRLIPFRAYKAVSEIFPNRLALSKFGSKKFGKLTESSPRRRQSLCSRNNLQTVIGLLPTVQVCKLPILDSNSLHFADKLHESLTQNLAKKKDEVEETGKLIILVLLLFSQGVTRLSLWGLWVS